MTDLDRLDASLTLDIAKADPIFILGIMPRSGTNYLRNLICLHPACAPSRTPISEDFFLEPSDLLLAYTWQVRKRWDPMWGVFDDELMRRFSESLGDGLISFLWKDRGRRLVAKTPSVQHIERFFTLFPRARLLILVRDGRSVVQSCMSTFGWEFDRAAQSWAAASDEIRRFQSKTRRPTDRYLLVRYEDLLDDPRGSLSGILRFLALDEDAYDFEAAARLPVRGSSFYYGPGRGSVHWEPVERGPDFDPRQRWRDWPPGLHERFEWLAGEQLRFFGYADQTEPVRGPSRVFAHRLRDWAWMGRSAGRRIVYRVRVHVGGATRPLRERLGIAKPRG
jgi:protein-tyrosine sulfotransferase